MNEVQLNRKIQVLLAAYEQAELMCDKVGKENIKETIDEVISKFVGRPVKLAKDYLN